MKTHRKVPAQLKLTLPDAVVPKGMPDERWFHTVVG